MHQGCRSYRPETRKTRLMGETAIRLGRGAQFFHPNLAVRFEGAGEAPAPNRFGAVQSGCLHCGECDIGCNVGAKNTLDLNYLAVAERSGADVATQRGDVARAREPAAIDSAFAIARLARIAPSSRNQVFLCLGAVGTTEFLLRGLLFLGVTPRGVRAPPGALFSPTMLISLPQRWMSRRMSRHGRCKNLFKG